MSSMMRLQRKVRSAAGSAVRFARCHAGWIVVILGALLIVSAVAPLFSVGAQQQRRHAVESADLIKKRAEWFFRQRAYPLGFVPVGARQRALEQVRRMREAQGLLPETIAAPAAAALSTTNWTTIGPEPTAGDPFVGNTSGRVNAVAVDPRDTTNNTVYIGAADGGVWKTTDGGNTWAPLTDTQPSLSTGSLALDASSNPTTIYFGTGEENFAFDSLFGAGVLRSTDGGTTWTQDTTFAVPGVGNQDVSGPFIGGLTVQPNNPAVLLAAVEGISTAVHSGVYRSTNAGSSWTRVLPTVASGNFDIATSVVFDPNDATGNTAYAALGNPFGNATLNGVYKSTDGGNTWSLLTITGATQSSIGRVTLAAGPGTFPNTELFAAIADATTTSSNLLGLFKSTNGGSTWAKVTTAPTFCNSQCFYDMAVAVSPTSANIIFLGGSFIPATGNAQLFRSTDGGMTWNLVSATGSGTSIHPDVHAIAFSHDGTKLYVGNDGGVWSSTNVTNPSTAPGSQTWSNLNAPTLDITQFYPSISIHPTDSTQGFGGTQDNGTQRFFNGSTTWTNVGACGDGGWTIFDPITVGTVYVGCEDLGVPPNTPGFGPLVNKSTSDGVPGSFVGMVSGITTTDHADFIPPLVIDPTHSQNLYFGTFRLYQTANGATSWIQMAGGQDLTLGGACGGSPAFITTMAVAPSDSNTVYVGACDSVVQVTTNALKGASATFTQIITGLPPRSVTNLAVDPTNPMKAYVTFSGFSGFNGDALGHVFKTTNGTTWTDISGILPNIPVNDIVVDPADATGATLDIATDVGVFQTTNGGASWSVLGSSLPNSEVLSLKLQNFQRVLRAGTHGRGVWDLQLPVTPDFNFGTPIPTMMSVAVGQTAMFTIPINSTNGFNSPVGMTCAPTPATSDFTCGAANFNPPNPTPPANGSTSTVLSITPKANASVPAAPARKMPLGPWLLLVAALAAAIAVLMRQFSVSAVPRLRRRLALGFSLTLAVALLITMAACGGGGGGGNTGNPHTFTITITGTSGSTLGQTTTVSLTVHN